MIITMVIRMIWLTAIITVMYSGTLMKRVAAVFMAMMMASMLRTDILPTNSQFNYTYYTMAHKCNMRQLFAIPASYENNIALAKPEGRYAHAGIDPLFRQPFSSLALYLCAAKNS